MRRFAEEYSLDVIGQQAIDQLPWGHNITLMYEVPDKKAREFYTQKTKEYGWTRNVLSMQIESNLLGYFVQYGQNIGPESSIGCCC